MTESQDKLAGIIKSTSKLIRGRIEVDEFQDTGELMKHVGKERNIDSRIK